MINYKQIHYHPAIEELTEILSRKRQSADKAFFRVIIAYFLSKMAACMRASVDTLNWMGEIPINVYALALSPSGYGKNTTVNFIEENLICDFKKIFFNDTMPFFVEKHLNMLATQRSVRNHTSQGEEIKNIKNEFAKLGSYLFTFDSATSPAVKQMRQMLLMAGIGSINSQIDEIGTNLINSSEILNVFLELYDKGYTKQKLVKNSDTNNRGEDLDGSTPTNMLLFGEPSALLDGGNVEDAFYNYLKTGYARRTLFSMSSKIYATNEGKTSEQIYDDLCNPQNDVIIDKWANHFAQLADPKMYKFTTVLNRDQGIKLIEYQKFCEERAKDYKESQSIMRTEMINRFFKVLKLSGLFAFIDCSPNITDDHLGQAIKLVEESGDAFKQILTRDLPHMKLAKYINEQDHEVTHAEIVEDLPFFKGAANKKEMISMAKAYGISHNILITSRFNDDIEFISSKHFEPTNLDKLIISYSFDFAYGYYNGIHSFDNLKNIGTTVNDKGEPIQFCNHHFKYELDPNTGEPIEGTGHRKEENVLTRFNMIVLDIDNGTPIQLAQDLLQEYTYIMYTTKSHQKDKNGVIADRYRIILPMSHELELNQEEFKQFMDNILTYLPFEVDEAVKDIVHKWEGNPNAIEHSNQGTLLNILPFIPGSRDNDIYNKKFQNKKLANLSALERWFLSKISNGNRNNYMLRYTMALVDSGKTLDEVEKMVRDFNSKLQNPLPEQELTRTCLATAAKRYGGTNVNA